VLARRTNKQIKPTDKEIIVLGCHPDGRDAVSFSGKDGSFSLILLFYLFKN